MKRAVLSQRKSPIRHSVMSNIIFDARRNLVPFYSEIKMNMPIVHKYWKILWKIMLVPLFYGRVEAINIL